MESPETIRISVQQGEWVTSLDFSDAYFHIPIHQRSWKFRVSFPKPDVSILDPPLWPLNSSYGVHFRGQVSKIDGSSSEYKNPPVPRQLIDSSPHQRIMPPGHSVLPRPFPGVGLGDEPSEVRVRTQQVFEFVGYQYNLLHGLVRPTQNRWEAIVQKVSFLLSKLTCWVRKFMSLMGLLMAMEKQVPLGRLHMRPIQWHLKNHWRVPESLEKEIPVPRSLHPHLRWWGKEENVLPGQPLHPLRHTLQV